MDSVTTTDSVPNSRPFPFFKLPAELRNKIYRLVVITGQSLIVRDMHLSRFGESQDSGAYQLRSTYLALNHECDLQTYPDVWSSRSIHLCEFKDITSEPLTTTYTLGTPHSSNIMTTAMLSLNKESREEVAYIFYGENTFHFIAMSSLMPFMKDRTEETRKYIRCMRVTLTINDRDWYVAFAEHGRPATWKTAFSSLAKLPHFNIKKLCIEIDDRKAHILRYGLKLRSRSMLWLHKISKLENLEKLGLRYDTGSWTRPNGWERRIFYKDLDTKTEEELWRFLAPRMLKKEADDHSPDALQQRRIWDFCNTRKYDRTPITNECTGDGG